MPSVMNNSMNLVTAQITFLVCKLFIEFGSSTDKVPGFTISDRPHS